MSARDHHDLYDERRDEQIAKLTRIHTTDVRKLLAAGDAALLDRVTDGVVNALANDQLAQSIVRALAGFPDGSVGGSLMYALLERVMGDEAELLAIGDVERMEAAAKDDDEHAQVGEGEMRKLERSLTPMF